METPSLLDWLKAQLSRPAVQRGWRFGTAALALGWGAFTLWSSGPGIGYFGLGLGLGLLAFGFAVRSEAAPPSNLPIMQLGLPAEARPFAPTLTAPAFTLPFSFSVLHLPSVIVLAAFGQIALTDLTLYQHKNWLWGALCYACALLAFGWMLRRESLLGPARAFGAEGSFAGFRLRGWLLLGAALTGAYAFFAAGKNPEGFNEFRPSGVAAWIAATALWVAAIWDGPLDPRQWLARLQTFLTTEVFTVRLRRVGLLLLIILAVGAYFRFAYLKTIPAEMTSDHVEKLLDVGDLVSGQNKIFFDRNTGREPLQFYFAALIINLFQTGLTHLTLKITGAIAGLLLLPFVYLLGKEIEDENFGLIAVALTAISFWATAISRVGLRFPLSPVFVAPTLYFLLRGLRRNTRNDFILAGLFLGAGLYGYSTIRVLPVVIGAAILWFAVGQRSKLYWAGLAVNTTALVATAFVVFLPLLRYALEPGNQFWYRSFSRLAATETDIKGSPFFILLQNYWNALRMFNWKGDVVWVNTIPNMPMLDFISGALLILGTLYVLVRLIARRDRVAGFLPLAILLLMLPSTLSFAFPDENPSAVRIGGAIPFVFLIAAYPLWLMLRQMRAAFSPKVGVWVGGLSVAVVLGVAGQINHTLYFATYPPQYALSAQNASEMGKVIDGFAHSIGSYETAYVRPYPYWVDTRAVGMYAGDFWHDFAIQKEQLADPLADPRPKLFILHPQDQETIAELRQLYPLGKLAQYSSAIPYHDFLMYTVPGEQDLDETTLPPP